MRGAGGLNAEITRRPLRGEWFFNAKVSKMREAVCEVFGSVLRPGVY